VECGKGTWVLALDSRNRDVFDVRLAGPDGPAGLTCNLPCTTQGSKESEMELTDDELMALERVANTLRGMRFDRRIPTDTIQCTQGLAADIDAITERLTDDDEDDEPDVDRLRDDRDEHHRLAKEDDE